MIGCDRLGHSRAPTLAIRPVPRASGDGTVVARDGWPRPEGSVDQHHRHASASSSPRYIERQLALGFGLIAAVSIAMCAFLIVQIDSVAGFVSDMRHDEAGIRESSELTADVREQYIHLAHTLIQGDRSHVDHYREWSERVKVGARDMRAKTPESDRWRLVRIVESSEALDAILDEALLPGAQSGARDVVRAIHERAEAIAEEAADEADAVALAVENRMVSSHISATHSARLGLTGGLACVAFVILLSAGYTLRLRNLLLRPLRVLSDAAVRFGAGDLDVRVAGVGKGELAAVATAFDRMAEGIAERERKLVQAERMAAIGQLAAGVAHEMNNPIGIIRGYLKTMDPDGDPGDLREELRILDEEAAACQRIAEDLLTFARVPDLRVSRVRAETFLEEGLERLREVPDLERHEIVLDADPAEVWLDRGRIRQVLANLVLNAAHAMSEGGSIHVSGRRAAGGSYVVEVSDSGSGIDMADIPHIFEPFYSKHPGGSGLGLAVSRAIVVAHGGTIDVTTRPSGGTSMCFALPAPSERREP